MTEEQEFMSEEAFNELIDNLEMVEKLTLYGRKNIKYYYKKLKEENEKYKYLYQTALDNLVKADRENIKLNETIQKMLKYIKQEDVSEKFCDYKVVCDMHCEECILAYFREDEKENT